ncbi:MAG: 4-(cytidine 5'-diphospho)-2-C-methyl-D-erythritol kinase [Chloroflexota bacterium]
MSDGQRVIIREAHAKINLCLEIIGRRQDNYHDITSVMQLVGLSDTLTFSAAETLSLECDHAGLAAEGDSNLVLKAARLLREASGIQAGAYITLEKQIPMSAGLGGGSSDAAAALRGLSELWGLQPGKDDMLEIAMQLGSDVPFFLGGPTALVEGRGERVTRMPSPPAGWALLVSPRYDLQDKTRRLYASLTRNDMSEGIVTHQLIAGLIAGQFPPSSLLFNGFERAAGGVFEGLDRVRAAIMRAGGRDVHLSGSGPTFFSLYTAAEENKARRVHEVLQGEGMRAYLASLIR